MSIPAICRSWFSGRLRWQQRHPGRTQIRQELGGKCGFSLADSQPFASQELEPASGMSPS